ncbi:MAG TPA: hypothetical protein VE360_18620 [Pyrinomonadaceae bacterium]|nr:hypothetical protein [Pyrinomonadaceae bacterium]
MKNVLRLLATVAVAAAFALPAHAQDPAAQDAAAQQNEARAALYQKFLDLRVKKDAQGNIDPAAQKQAYEAGKEYLSKYSSNTGEDNAAIVAFIQKWVKNYEDAVRDFTFNQAIDKGDFQGAIPPGRELLAINPENVRVNLLLARTGYVAVSKGNKAVANDALAYIRRTMQLVEAGKVADNWAPFASKEDALGWLNYMEGFLILEGQPDAAVKSLLKAVQSNSAASKEPSAYDTLAFIYTKEYQRAAAEYQQKFPQGTEITPELKPEYDRLQVRLDKIADRIIDAQARVVAFSTKPDQQELKNRVMARLTAIYKSRHNESDAGLKELIAGVASKPIMIPGQEPEPTPSSPTTPSTTPATGGSTQASQTGRPAATTPGGANTGKPAAATTTPQPKPATTAPRP